MPLLDLSNIMPRAKSPDQGWTSGTTVAPQGAFLTSDVSGHPVGITSGFQAAIGRGLRGAAAQMPGGGAFQHAWGDAEPAGQVADQNLGFRRFNPQGYGLSPVQGSDGQPNGFWQYLKKKFANPTSQGS